MNPTTTPPQTRFGRRWWRSKTNTKKIQAEKIYYDDFLEDYFAVEVGLDPLLHFRESEVVAEGEGWVALVESCGEIRAYKNGDRVYADDLADEYVDDEALDKAIESGELEVANNNWYELQFFAETEDGATYLDITPDLVAFSFNEVLEQFKSLISDKEWLERFADEVERLYHELYETDASETTLLELDTLVDNIRKEIK